MSSLSKITLTSYDDLFKTQEERDDMKREKIHNIELSELHPLTALAVECYGSSV